MSICYWGRRNGRRDGRRGSLSIAGSVCRCRSSWLRGSGGLRRSWFLRLNTSFPCRTGIHIRRQPLGLPFLFEISRGFVGCFAHSHDIVPRIDLRPDLATGFCAPQIQGDRISPIGSEINMHTADVFEQRSHGHLPRGQ